MNRAGQARGRVSSAGPGLPAPTSVTRYVTRRVTRYGGPNLAQNRSHTTIPACLRGSGALGRECGATTNEKPPKSWQAGRLSFQRNNVGMTVAHGTDTRRERHTVSDPKPRRALCKNCRAPIMWHPGLSHRPIETTPRPVEPGAAGFVVRRRRDGSLCWEDSRPTHDEHLAIHRCPAYWRSSGPAVDRLRIDLRGLAL